jgi:fructose-1,6-bisphosphatase/inositol monophosphatase family enzyme
MLFTTKDHALLSEILIEAARVEIMPRFRNLKDGEIREKLSATDLVTEADEAAERFICARLAKAFPQAVLIGEEGVSADPDLLGKLSGAELAIVIDPVDGTLNYASSLTVFASMAAVIVRGEIVAAVIHDPVVNDCAMALRGEGAWLERPDGRRDDLKVARPQAMSEMTGMVSYTYFAEPLRSTLPARFPRASDISSLRCCGHEYRLAAAGHCHFLAYGKLMPWDHAPGSLLHREAGGYSGLINGNPYQPAVHATGLLCAPDRDSWLEIRAALFDT